MQDAVNDDDRDAQEKLADKYPSLLKRNSWSGQLMPDRPRAHQVHVGEGWLPLIEELCVDISRELRKHPDLIEPVYAVQIKEKFGGLRFYLSIGTEEINNLVREAERKSYTICETCGQPGESRKDLGWILTLCDEHYTGRKALLDATNQLSD